MWIREEPEQGGGGGQTSVASGFFNGMAPKHLKPRGSPADACSSSQRGVGTLGGAISTQVPSHRNPGVHRCTPSPGSDPTSVPLSSGSSSQLYDFRLGPRGGVSPGLLPQPPNWLLDIFLDSSKFILYRVATETFLKIKSHPITPICKCFNGTKLNSGKHSYFSTKQTKSFKTGPGYTPNSIPHCHREPCL